MFFKLVRPNLRKQKPGVHSVPLINWQVRSVLMCVFKGLNAAHCAKKPAGEVIVEI